VNQQYCDLSMRRRQWLCGFFLGCMALALNPTPGRAQVSASIIGNVEDTSGAAVNAATITIKNEETGATRTVTTAADGSFQALSLPLGLQEVKAEKQGFKSVVRTGINLEVGQEAVVNLRLEVGELTQQIAIVGEAPVVNVTPSSVSGIVGKREVKDLPLNGRSFDNLITLNPGTINYSAMKSTNTSTSNGNTFSVAGRRTGENLFLLNGVEYMGTSQLAVTPGGASGELLGIDAIREFNVLTDTYSAEYGKRAGAQVGVVTQSGTNALHGSVFEFVRNSAFDSASPFDLAGAPPFRRNQFGGALGGPLKKDRLFLFGNYEGFRQSLDLSSLSVVPDVLARTGMLPNPSTGVYGTVSGLNNNILPYMTFWPAPDANGELMVPSTTNSSVLVPSGVAFSHNNPKEHLQEDFGTVRSDYNIGNRDTLTGAYTIDDGTSLIPLADPLFASETPLRMQVLSLGETHVFSPELLNNFTVGFSRASFSLIGVNPPVGTTPGTISASAAPFVTGAGPGGIVVGGGATTTAGGTITSAGPNNAAGVDNHRNLFTYEDNVRVSKGINQFSAGVWFERLQDNEDTASRQAGAVTFASLTTFLQGAVATNQFQVVPLHTALSWRSFFGASYVEDSIRVRRNFTIDLGLRHEFTTGWNEAYGRAANYVLNSQDVLVTAPVVGNSVFSQNNAARLFSPRVGLAWDVFGNGKTAVRAGYGTYYSLIDALSFLLNSVAPYNGSVSCPSVGSVCPSTAGSASLFSFIPFTPGKSFPACGTGPTPCATFAPQGIQSNAQTPAVQEWNLAIEQQLTHDTALRVAYVGSFAVHELLSIDPNSIPAQICATTTCASGGTPGTVKGSVSMGQQYIPVQSRPNPNLSGGFFWFTEGNSSYNALQVDLTHRMSKGLEFRGNYTWSKNLDMNSGLTIAQASNQPQLVLDRNDLRRDWGPAAFDVTSQSSISALYQLPFGNGQRWMGDAGGIGGKLVSGWQLNGIETFLTGFPFTPLVGSNRSGDGDVRNPDRPNINTSYSGPVVTGNPNQWFNPTAFSLPTAGTYGDLGRGTLRGPGLADVDFSLFKGTSIDEKATVQFRAEFFNILNHQNFGPPNATVFSGTTISPSAGLISTTATFPRQIQLGLKLIF